MFTGIITDIGSIVRLSPEEGALHLDIATRFNLSDADIGASIACNGICLTVTTITDSGFSVTASAETLAATSMNRWVEGQKINLERALKMGDELGGHMVSGHVDGVATITDISAHDLSQRLTITPPKELNRYIARKGSVALDGISLTVNSVDETSFSVNIIPHTWEHTNLQYLNAGDTINLEVDLFARYIERHMECA